VIANFDNGLSPAGVVIVAVMKDCQTADALKDPPCPECGAMMWISEIEPDKPDFDRRTFECPRCLHTETTVVGF
jgi:hypothetical protein